LRDSGFAMREVSVISKHEEDKGKIAGVEVSDGKGNKAAEGAVKGAATGGVLGGLTGLLVGIGLLAIPGIGPVMTAGAVGTALASTFAGGAIGTATGGLVGALIGLGIPAEHAETYNTAVQNGDYLVMVDGSEEEVHQAELILHSGGIKNYGVYDAPKETTTDGTPIDVTTEPLTTPINTPTQDLTEPAAAGTYQKG